MTGPSMRAHRRQFLRLAGEATAGALAATVVPDAAWAQWPGRRQPQLRDRELARAIDTMPNYCSHEHWGSFPAIGFNIDSFRCDTDPGALPKGRVSVWDMIIDPYLGSWMYSAGSDLESMWKKAGHKGPVEWWREDPQGMFDTLAPHFRRHAMTGVFQCTRRGVLELHGVDLAKFTAESWFAADQRVGAAYANMYGWYREGMRKAHLRGLTRPVTPEFYTATPTPAALDELSMTRTVLRIDPLIDFWWGLNIRRDKLAMWTGVYPGDAASWRKFLAVLFEKAKAGGAVGIKQLQAYRRTLAYAPRTDGEVRFRGELSADEVVRLGDWIVHECSKLAHDLGWPHQVHVGTNNLPSSAPLPLGELAQRYPRQKLVLIHCWPYLEEAGYLAKFNANVYLDTCWQPVLNPEFLLRALRTWLGYVPTHKVVCSHDSTTLEMAVGSSRFTREALAAVLGEVRATSGLGRDDVLATARALLFDNSLALYGAPLDG